MHCQFCDKLRLQGISHLDSLGEQSVYIVGILRAVSKNSFNALELGENQRP